MYQAHAFSFKTKRCWEMNSILKVLHKGTGSVIRKVSCLVV